MGFKGERVGRFVLDRKLGPTLEGELWKARTDASGRFGPPAGASGDPPWLAIRFFLDAEWAEALRASGLPATPEHDNVCRFVEGAPAFAPPWLAREFVEGETLAGALAAQPQRYLPLAVAIPVAIQLLRGLAAFHKAGLAHLDLRPGNVLIGERGHVKLADACTEGWRRAIVARLFHRLRPLPPEHAARLLPYVPPEQRRGEVTGQAADMYGLGVTLYEMLIGERPESFDVRMPSQRDRRIPKVFDEIVLPALERSPRARTQNALGLEQRLLEGVAKAGFVLDLKADPAAWVKATPWRERPAAP